MQDEILDELHAVREQLLREAGGDLAGLYRWLKEREAESARELVPQPTRKPEEGESEAA